MPAPEVRAKGRWNERRRRAVTGEDRRETGMATARVQDEGSAKLSAGERKLTRRRPAHIDDSLLPVEPTLTVEKNDKAAAIMIKATRERRGDESSMLFRSSTGDRRCTRVAVF